MQVRCLGKEQLAESGNSASFVGVDGFDGRAMTQLLEVRSYDPESWQACVRALDCD